MPYDRVVLDLNVDMVGRSTGKVQGIAPTCAPLFEETVTIGQKHGIEVDPDQQPSWRVAYLTDSYHFTRFDVPAIEFFTGMHPTIISRAIRWRRFGMPSWPDPVGDGRARAALRRRRAEAESDPA